MAIKDLINKIENIRMSFGEGALLLFIFTFIRTFLENFANSGNFYHLSGIIDTFFHYPVGFSIVVLASIIIARILTKEEMVKVAKFMVLGSAIMILPPIVDLVVHAGAQIPYIFISGTFSQLFLSFITYFGGEAIGVGIKTEVLIAILGLGFYIFGKTKEMKRAVAGAFLLYSVIFIFLASPAIIFGIQNTFTNEYQTTNLSTIVDFYYHREPLNAITTGRTFVVDNNNFLSPLMQKMENQYSITLSIVFLLIQAMLIFWCLFLYSHQKFFAVLKNFRYLRILHYFLMLSLGIYLGIHILGKNPVGSLFDLLSLVSVFMSILFGWLFAVWENDQMDVGIDKISNIDRPLAKDSIFSPEEWGVFKCGFLFYALSFSFLNGLYSFVFMLLFIFIYHIYSTPPLRLKRFLGLSSFLIAINALLAVWMGFFIASGTENLSAFPAKYIFGILTIFFLIENVKNIKDIEGDRKEGIKTLPVILGERKGKFVIGICAFLGTLLAPFIFYLSLSTFLLAIFFGAILFFLINKKHFQEEYVFLVYFIYVIFFLMIMK